MSPPGEKGTTLVELVMALALAALALGLVLPLLGSSADQAALSRSQSQATAQLSSLLQALGNEVGSAAVVYSPTPAAGQTFWAAQGLPSGGGNGVGPGDALLALSQYDPVAGGNGAAVCNQWAVEPAGGAGALVTRSWSPGQGGTVPFEVVAPTPWPPPAPPFSLVSTPGVGVQVHLTLLGLGRDQSGPLTMTTTAFSMDLAQPGLPATACEQAPDP